VEAFCGYIARCCSQAQRGLHSPDEKVLVTQASQAPSDGIQTAVIRQDVVQITLLLYPRPIRVICALCLTFSHTSIHPHPLIHGKTTPPEVQGTAIVPGWPTACESQLVSPSVSPVTISDSPRIPIVGVSVSPRLAGSGMDKLGARLQSEAYSPGAKGMVNGRRWIISFPPQK
jgi:hypothetical protein